MTTKSGWCIGPAGARIHHENCPSKECGCPCHMDTDRLLLSGIRRSERRSDAVNSGVLSDPAPLRTAGVVDRTAKEFDR